MTGRAVCDSAKQVKRAFKDFLDQQKTGMSALATAGVIGLHMVSGPLVGFALGYGCDAFFGTHPYGKILFLIVGVGAGFLNVYRDSRILLDRIAREDAKKLKKSEHQKP